MFDIGFWEILLVLVLALVVIGPERLPGAARTLGLWVGKSRRFIEGVKSDVEEEFDISEFKRVIHNQEVQLKELQRQMTQQVTPDSLNDEGPSEKTHTIENESSAVKDKSGNGTE